MTASFPRTEAKQTPTAAATGAEPTRRGRTGVRRWFGWFGIAVLAVLAVATWDRIALRWQRARGERLLTQRQNADALAVLRRALQIDMTDVHTIQDLARVHRRLNDLGPAALLLDRAQTLGGDADWIERERRLALAQSGRIREVESYLADMLINAGADGPDICEAYAQGYFSNLRSAPALRLLDAWQKSFPDDAQPRFMRAYFWQSMNQPARAVDLYYQGLKLAPGRSLMRRRLAAALLAADRIEQAEKELAACLAESPGDAEVHYLAAECAYQRSDLDAAVRELDQTLKRAPDHLAAHRLKGQLLLARGAPEPAVKELRQVLNQHPYDKWAHEAMGRALRSLGRDAEADEHFEFVANAEEHIGRMDRLVRQAIADPDDAELRFEVGAILFQYGDPSDAARWMRAALELNPNHRGAHRALASYYEQIGDAARATRERQLASTQAQQP